MAKKKYDSPPSGSSPEKSDEPVSPKFERDEEKAKRKSPRIAKLRLTAGGKGVKDQKNLSKKLKERLAQSMIHEKIFDIS